MFKFKDGSAFVRFCVTVLPVSVSPADEAPPMISSPNFCERSDDLPRAYAPFYWVLVGGEALSEGIGRTSPSLSRGSSLCLAILVGGASPSLWPERSIRFAVSWVLLKRGVPVLVPPGLTLSDCPCSLAAPHSKAY